MERVEVTAALLDHLEGLGELAEGLDGRVRDAVGPGVLGERPRAGHAAAVPTDTITTLDDMRAEV